MNLSFRNQSHINLNCKAKPVVDNILLQITNTTDILKIQTKAHRYLFLRNLLGKTTMQTKKMLRTEVLAQGVPPLCKGKSHYTQWNREPIQAKRGQAAVILKIISMLQPTISNLKKFVQKFCWTWVLSQIIPPLQLAGWIKYLPSTDRIRYMTFMPNQEMFKRNTLDFESAGIW